ncbi:hypothetical protein MPLDJ20_30043 [Mesorhizobium plurifarium]|uniref:Uncharacterized protein n=1 Tax=Mesorhizobium plurifarium TaxID=69974 RepID=A0A090FA94_MESPL|nr:hypothetical protein MPLDJ20_30043 [Mesorhizobium plurifarium]
MFPRRLVAIWRGGVGFRLLSFPESDKRELNTPGPIMASRFEASRPPRRGARVASTACTVAY